MYINDKRSGGYGQASKPAGNRQGYSQNQGSNRNAAPAFVAPLNYDPIDDAERVMKSLQRFNSNRQQLEINLTTSQIRKFLASVNLVRNKVDLYMAQNKAATKLSSELAVEVRFLKVGVLYQAAKDDKGNVERFFKAANLSDIIDDIGDDLNKFKKFCKYAEALVAYHKFMGGKDK